MILVLCLSMASIGWVFQNELVEWIEMTTGLFAKPSGPDLSWLESRHEVSRGG